MADEDESFDVVDQHDNVMRQQRRSVVHSQGLLHRAVHIFVFDRDKRLLVQLRSAFKDEDPLLYTSSASGHVSAGETYEQAAYRELEEELGLRAPLTFVDKLPACPETNNEHTALFETQGSLDELKVNEQEIAEMKVFHLEELREHLREYPEKFSSAFLQLLKWRFGF